jgi:hypothetical protein
VGTIGDRTALDRLIRLLLRRQHRFRVTHCELTFQAMQVAGVNVARWFVFFDGRAGIMYDTVSGSPTGLDEAVLRDIDKAVAIAKSYSIKIIFVLISFEWMKKKINDVVGGRSEILSDPVKQDDLVNNVFVPLFRHLADDTFVVAYDVANEPEWSLLGVPIKVESTRA